MENSQLQLKYEQLIQHFDKFKIEQQNSSEKNLKIQKSLEDLIPSASGCEDANDYLNDARDDAEEGMDNGERILVEIAKLKTHLNNVELQLYEANEKISDLLESVSIALSST